MVSKSDLFSEDVPSKIIKGFPYPERFCKYCEEPLQIWKAFHIQETPELYKVIFICLNKDCESYDEEARDAYVRVYYSSNEAYDILNRKLVQDPRSIFEGLRT
jgi:hypothetical protein